MTINDPGDNEARLRWIESMRYLAGELSGAEQSAFEAWLDEDGERRREFETLRELWERSAGLSQTWDAERAITRLRRAALQDTETRPAAIRRRWSGLVTPSRGPVGILAAAAVIGAMVFWGTDRTKAAPLAPSPDSMVVLRTAPGQRMQGRLPDGTEVQLAPGSVLTRSSAYGRTDRRVWLEGVAYFSVHHDDERPFVVLTADAVARDIGTKFVVRRRAGQVATEVAVVEGTVAISARDPADSIRAAASGPGSAPRPSREVILHGDDLGRISRAGIVTRVSQISLTAYTDWIVNRLRFSDAPLADVVVELALWYDVPVRIESPELKRVRVSGVFGAELVDEVVRMLATSINAHSYRDSAGVHIRATGTPPATRPSVPR